MLNRFNKIFYWFALGMILPGLILLNPVNGNAQVDSTGMYDQHIPALTYRHRVRFEKQYGFSWEEAYPEERKTFIEQLEMEASMNPPIDKEPVRLKLEKTPKDPKQKLKVKNKVKIPKPSFINDLSDKVSKGKKKKFSPDKLKTKLDARLPDR